MSSDGLISVKESLYFTVVCLVQCFPPEVIFLSSVLASLTLRGIIPPWPLPPWAGAVLSSRDSPVLP